MRCRLGFEVVGFFAKNQFFELKTFSIPIVKNKRLLFNYKQVFFISKLLSTEEELFFLR